MSTRIPVQPGEYGMVIGACATITSALTNTCQFRLGLSETTFPNEVIRVCGPVCPAALAVQNIACAIGVGLTAQPLADAGGGTNLILDVASSPLQVSIPLPRYPIGRDFVVDMDLSIFGAGDQLSGGRLIVAFGQLSEILTCW